MKLHNIKHIFFDLDHTLWDFDRNSALTFEKIFQIHGVKAPLDSFLHVYNEVNRNYWKLYRHEKVDKEKLRYGRLRDTFDSIEFEASDELILQLSIDYITYLTTFNHVYEGALEILDYLKPNYELHIITNGFKEAQNKKMDGSKMGHFFKTMTNAEVVGVKKPNPEIFKFALNEANAKPEESIMVGDSFEADVQGAMEVGLDAIFFNCRNEDVGQSVKQVRHLIQLKNYL